MGDYTKIIVSCTVKCDKAELEKKVEDMGLYSSAYHSQEVCNHIQENNWHHRKGCLNVVLSGQTKYGRGQKEFLEWLKPFVVQGSGYQEIWAFQIDEYGSDGLTVYKLEQNLDI